MKENWHTDKYKFKKAFTKIKTLDQALLLLEKAYKICKDVNELSLAFDTPVDIITKYLIQLDIFDKKWCSKCNDGAGAWCNVDQFSKNSSKFDGLVIYCKLCIKSQYKQYYSKPETKEVRKEYNSRPEVMDARKEYKKEYNSRPEVRDYNKEYNSRSEVRDRYNARRKERYNTDIAFRIRDTISSRINEILKANNTSKMGKSINDYLPYTIQELIDHLELQFLPGMTLENHGLFGWHVDHKKPISSFNITSMECEEFQECWALSNLQPLWSDDNWAKSNKYEEPTDEELEEILENLSDEELQEVLKD